jgi:hypothetical protein
VEQGSEAYLRWLTTSTRIEPESPTELLSGEPQVRQESQNSD